MKATVLLAIAVMAVLVSGCASKSPYASDPRCIGVNQNYLYPWLGTVPGPTYMDYVMKYRRDKLTEWHHPRIYIDGERVAAINVAEAPTNSPPAIQALLTPFPPAKPY